MWCVYVWVCVCYFYSWYHSNKRLTTVLLLHDHPRSLSLCLTSPGLFSISVGRFRQTFYLDGLRCTDPCMGCVWCCRGRLWSRGYPFSSQNPHHQQRYNWLLRKECIRSTRYVTCLGLRFVKYELTQSWCCRMVVVCMARLVTECAFVNCWFDCSHLSSICFNLRK